MIQYTYFDNAAEKKAMIDFVKTLSYKEKDQAKIRKFDKLMLCVIGTQVDDDGDGSIVLMSN